MSTIQNLFQQAQLAEAAYANLWNSGTNSTITDSELVKAVLQDANNGGAFSASQVTAFVADWSVVSQQPDTIPNGFSATLFKNNHTGQYSLAIRGSLQPVDFYQDTLLISTDGIAVSQVIDLYNYWQSLTHTGAYNAAKLTTQSVETAYLTGLYLGSGGGIPTALVELFTGVSIPTGYDAARAFFIANGYVVEGNNVYKVGQEISTNLYTDPTDPRRTGTAIPGLSSVSVDGHSLGGHLAMAFSRLFPNATNSVTAVNDAYYEVAMRAA